MRWTKLCLAICLVGGANAGSVLDFDSLGPNDIPVPNTYGDFLPGTPNIDMSYLAVDYTPQTFSGLTGLVTVLITGSPDHEIIFTPDAGFGVHLIGFDLGTYQPTHVQSLRLLDGNDNLLTDIGAAPFNVNGSYSFAPDYFQAGVLKLDFTDLYYFGLDNIQFEQFQINGGAPEPSTLSALGLALAGLAWLRRRR